MQTALVQKGLFFSDLDDGTIDAQIIIFLLAGFETSSSVLSFAIHVLATRPDIQDKLRKHVIQVTEGKEVNYDLLTQLDYLEAFLNGKILELLITRTIFFYLKNKIKIHQQ